MKFGLPFGLLSAVATSTVFLTYALLLLGINYFYTGRDLTPLLLFFIIKSRLVGDWFFWAKLFSQEMDSGNNIKDWRASVKGILFSQSSSVWSLIYMGFDAILDVTFVYMAFKVAAPAMWIMLIFCFGQAIGAPLHGGILRVFSRNNTRLFYMGTLGVLLTLAFEVSGLMPGETYTQLFGISHFPKSTQMLMILSAKCFLTGLTVLAKETLAEVIKVETIKNPIKKYGS